MMMKKVMLGISLLLAFLLAGMGIHPVSANEGNPSYCVLIETDYGFANPDAVMGKLESKVQGDLVNPDSTNVVAQEVMNGRQLDELDYDELQTIGAKLGVDYVLLLEVYNNQEYDPSIHEVDCVLSVITVGSNVQKTQTSNILVPTGDNMQDENEVGVMQFLDEMEPIAW